MREYRQISFEERVKIEQLKRSKVSVTSIALELARAKSTISREIRRNQAPPGAYWSDRAQDLTKKRRKRACLLDRHAELKAFVLTQLYCQYWTPEQIAGYLKWRQKELPSVSHETIYSWIYQPGQKKMKLWTYLTRHKAKRGPRKSKGAGLSRIPDRISIHDRPKAIEKRREFGHWEGDLMSFMKGTQHVLVLRERKTMFTLSVPLKSKKAPETAREIIHLMKNLPPEARKTLTFDNGGEFAAHGTVCNALKMQSFFCDAYASWQKGGVENTNGRLRRDLPRKTDIQALERMDFDEIIENYNTTPRKKFKWRTPLDVFQRNLRRVALRT